MEVPESILEAVRSYLSDRFSDPCLIRESFPLSGGCIHHAFKLDTDKGAFFLKWNEASQAGNFRAEQRGLELLGRHSVDFIATPLTTGQDDQFSFLLLKFIGKGIPSGGFWEDFGHKLAGLHKNTAPLFGMDHDNFVGRLPQSNRQSPDYVSFFIEQRLRPQAHQALASDLVGTGICEEFERLYLLLPDLLPQEPPALLHGDLWQGNFLCTNNGCARLIDPAVYYGHREAEIAFTTLFGGFAPEFYESYHESSPLAPGWQERTDIFNLYPLLVHLNLFGKSYLSRIRQILARYH